MEPVLQNRLRVMMIAEGTYPYHWGGVSTWCHLLLSDLPNIDFTLVSLVGDPATVPQFKLPASVVEFRAIPLWGVREVLETQPSLRLAELWSRKRRTTQAVVADGFVPILRAFLEQLFADAGDPHHMALLVHAMHRFFLTHDFDKAMRSAAVWDCFVDVAQFGFPRTAAQYGYAGERFSLADLTTCFHWLYHWLFPLASPLPKVDVAHAAMAGICTLVAVAAKLEHGAAFMLTEHGIYLRERYLAEAATAYSLFRKLFSLRFARRMTELSYALADQVAPCCDFNQRWELRNGAQPAQVQTIYYGVDSVVFTPQPKPVGEPPVVVWVGRIDPLKDLFTLLRAAALVHAAHPDVQFRLYGSAPPGNEAYYEKCLELRAELGLTESVIFGGFRASPATAFNEGDLVVLSSVSEAFPFVILEAMLCERPVVATAVGGVPEQIEGCGIAVEPRNPSAMADAILKLIGDPALSRALGIAARQKASQEYSVRQSAQAHETAYRRLANHKPGIVPVRVRSRQRRGRHTLPFAPAGALAEIVRPFAFDMAPALVRNARAAPAVAIPTAPDGANHRPAARVAAGTVAAGTVAAGTVAAGTASDLVNRIAVADEHDPTWRDRHADAIVTLALDIAQRDVQPIDALEVTALLESIGITDDVALQRYGAPDVFLLGEAVLTEIKVHRLAQRRTEAATPIRASQKEALLDYLKGPLGMAPPILLMLTILAFGLFGAWSQVQVMLLSAGMTGSLMLTNGLIQGVSRRTSIYLGMAKPRMAARYLFISTAIVTAVSVSIVLLAAAMLHRLELFSGHDLVIFLLAFTGLTVVWMMAGGLSLLRQPLWLSISLAAGLLMCVGLNLILAPVTTYHLAIGAAGGYLITLALLGLALVRGFARLEARPTSSKAIMRLPSTAYLLDEAAPYFAYGFVYMVLIFLPHLFGWLGAVPAGEQRSAALTNIELGLTLSMPPLILAYGVADYSLRLFWRCVGANQAATPATHIETFGAALLRFAAQRRSVYAVVLTVLTVLARYAFSRTLAEGWLGQWLQTSDPAQLLFIFDVSLLAYWLLGLGLFNSMFAVTLGRPDAAFRAVVWSCVVMIIAGATMASLHFAFAAVAFAIAAFVFAAISWEECNQVLRAADYCFAAVLP